MKRERITVAIETLFPYEFVGFNCVRYDNHILYARMLGRTNKELYDLSQRIINGSRNGMFSQAYYLSYADVYDFSSKKNRGGRKMKVTGTSFPAYLYDSRRRIVLKGHVIMYDSDFTYKTVHCRFYGDNHDHSYLVSDEEGKFYRGSFWLKERDDEKASELTKLYRLKKIDELEEERDKLCDKLDEINGKITKARHDELVYYGPQYKEVN